MTAVDDYSTANKIHFNSIAHQYDDNDHAVKRAEKFALLKTIHKLKR